MRLGLCTEYIRKIKTKFYIRKIDKDSKHTSDSHIKRTDSRVSRAIGEDVGNRGGANAKSISRRVGVGDCGGHSRVIGGSGCSPCDRGIRLIWQH